MAMVMPLAFSSGALSMLSYARNCACPRVASVLVIAAVSVVLPWSTCPIVPTFTCGFVRSNFFFAIAFRILLGPQSLRAGFAGGCAAGRAGALIQIRTGDLVLTKNALCRLSYEGELVTTSRVSGGNPAARCQATALGDRMPLLLRARVAEPERGFEPLTYRLQVGCATVAPPGPVAPPRPGSGPRNQS